MKKRISYECEICGTKYGEAEAAQACEDHGAFDEEARASIPIGLMIGNPANPTAFYTNMSFAVAKVTQFHNPHYATLAKWACRDNGRGDNLGGQLCGNGELLRPKDWAKDVQRVPLTIEDLEHPTWRRLETWLFSQDIEPTCLVGGVIMTTGEARKFLGESE